MTNRQLICSALALVASAAGAQQNPSKPITVVSAASPATSGDAAVRMMAAGMGQSMGQPLIVEMRNAARGAQAYAVVSKAAPDGHTVMYATSGTLVYGRFLFKNMAFDPLKDLSPISLALTTPQYVAINNGVPASSLQEFIEYAKKNPGKLEYGSTGPGSYFHLAGEALKNVAGINLLHVPYAQSNFAQLVSDWSSGRLALYFATLAQLKPNLSKVKALAVLDRQRSKHMPDVPTIVELLPGYQPFVVWYGFMGPTGLPPDIARRFAAESRRAMLQPQVTAKIEDLGMTIIGGTPEELGIALREETETIGKLVKTIGLQPE